MKFIRKLQTFSTLSGLDIMRAIRSLIAAPRFLRDVAAYRRASAEADGRFQLRWKNVKPMLLDYTEQAGTAGGHYFFQDLWAARKVFEARPARHVDIGSRIDGFVAHVLSFMPVDVIDIRPLVSSVERMSFIQADATTLSDIPNESIASLSSLHAVEHFGLGRYGDPVDPNACFTSMKSLARVLQRGGRLYFSVPIGFERLEFNSQRVFSPFTVLEVFKSLQLLSFSAVNDAGDFCRDANPDDFTNAGYSCGLFEFSKI